MADQGSLFSSAGAVPRPPGWRLVANRGGVQGWHLVEQATTDGGIVTVCGVVGRVIDDDTKTLVPCPICAEP